MQLTSIQIDSCQPHTGGERLPPSLLGSKNKRVASYGLCLMDVAIMAEAALQSHILMSHVVDRTSV